MAPDDESHKIYFGTHTPDNYLSDSWLIVEYKPSTYQNPLHVRSRFYFRGSVENLHSPKKTADRKS